MLKSPLLWSGQMLRCKPLLKCSTIWFKSASHKYQTARPPPRMWLSRPPPRMSSPLPTRSEAPQEVGSAGAAWLVGPHGDRAPTSIEACSSPQTTWGLSPLGSSQTKAVPTSPNSSWRVKTSRSSSDAVRRPLANRAAKMLWIHKLTRPRRKLLSWGPSRARLINRRTRAKKAKVR